jgi:hypothetical protein
LSRSRKLDDAVKEIDAAVSSAEATLTVKLFGLSGSSIMSIRFAYKLFVQFIAESSIFAQEIRRKRMKLIERHFQKLLQADRPALIDAYEADCNDWEELLTEFADACDGGVGYDAVQAIHRTLEADDEEVFDDLPDPPDEVVAKRGKLVALNRHNADLRDLLLGRVELLRSFHQKVLAFFDAEFEYVRDYLSQVDTLLHSEDVFSRIGISVEIIAQLEQANAHKATLIRQTITGLEDQRALFVKIYAYLMKKAASCVP